MIYAFLILLQYVFLMLKITKLVYWNWAIIFIPLMIIIFYTIIKYLINVWIIGKINNFYGGFR